MCFARHTETVCLSIVPLMEARGGCSTTLDHMNQATGDAVAPPTEAERIKDGPDGFPTTLHGNEWWSAHVVRTLHRNGILVDRESLIRQLDPRLPCLDVCGEDGSFEHFAGPNLSLVKGGAGSNRCR